MWYTLVDTTMQRMNLLFFSFSFFDNLGLSFPYILKYVIVCSNLMSAKLLYCEIMIIVGSVIVSYCVVPCDSHPSIHNCNISEFRFAAGLYVVLVVHFKQKKEVCPEPFNLFRISIQKYTTYGFLKELTRPQDKARRKWRWSAVQYCVFSSLKTKDHIFLNLTSLVAEKQHFIISPCRKYSCKKKLKRQFIRL